MIGRDWNALRVGDYVLVHDETDPDMPLIPGRVTEIEAGQRSNVVTVRVSSKGRATRVVQPRRLTVHLDNGEATERCWRCEARYSSPRATR